MTLSRFLFALALAAPAVVVAAPVTKPKSPASSPMESVFKRAKTNRAQIELAWNQTLQPQRAAMKFLLENAPDSDLQTLSAAFLRAQVQLAFEARAKSPWKSRLTEELFLNDVLPYASLSERRDNVRGQLRQLSLPLIQGIKTPGEAALTLNRKIFDIVKVKYSTERARPDQSPLESMASGKASCSGLSILLVDACRAVGIPSRVAGTPMWANGRGNHTWVEVWDGEWKFLGAAEGDDLNKGWFAGDASKANTGKIENAIFVSSWRKTGVSFPLVWDSANQSVGAQIVTTRYAPTLQLVADDGAKTRLLVSILNADGKRVEVPVVALDEKGAKLGEGTTRGETADTNDFLSFNAAHNSVVTLQIGGARLQVRVGGDAEQKVELRARPVPVAPALPPRIPVPLPHYVTPVGKPLAPAMQAKVEAAARRYFSGAVVNGPVDIESQKTLDQALLQNEPAVRAVVWQAFKASTQDALKKDFDANVARNGEHVAPFAIRTVGEKPKNGWGLVIAMHGGGGTAKEVNDSQWEGMKTHYRDHPELGGYKYMSLRAPNDSWNGFYDDYVYPLIENLIRAQTTFGEVDANRVYITGYSHGGYGAFAIGPKMPDRFAFIHSSAAAATDGESSSKTLRNTPFTVMVGEFDTAYDRLARNQRFDAGIKALRGERTDIFPVRVDEMKGFQHGNLPDRDELVEMLPATRNPVPRELTWEQTDSVVRDFFWLHSDAPAKNREIDATIKDNVLTVTTTGEVKTASALLDARLVDFSKPVSLSVNGKQSKLTVKPSFNTLCETMARRGDPELAFSARVVIAP